MARVERLVVARRGVPTLRHSLVFGHPPFQRRPSPVDFQYSRSARADRPPSPGVGVPTSTRRLRPLGSVRGSPLQGIRPVPATLGTDSLSVECAMRWFSRIVGKSGESGFRPPRGKSHDKIAAGRGWRGGCWSEYRCRVTGNATADMFGDGIINLSAIPTRSESSEREPLRWGNRLQLSIAGSEQSAPYFSRPRPYASRSARGGIRTTVAAELLPASNPTFRC